MEKWVFDRFSAKETRLKQFYGNPNSPALEILPSAAAAEGSESKGEAKPKAPSSSVNLTLKANDGVYRSEDDTRTRLHLLTILLWSLVMSLDIASWILGVAAPLPLFRQSPHVLAVLISLRPTSLFLSWVPWALRVLYFLVCNVVVVCATVRPRFRIDFFQIHAHGYPLAPPPPAPSKVDLPVGPGAVVSN